MYRENLRRLPDGENARLHLLLWTRNSCPPGPAADLSNRPLGFWEALADLLRNSGFDAVWYNSQIPDGITWKVEPPWRLFPALDENH